jgi:threonyl-tRNA synthetase
VAYACQVADRLKAEGLRIEVDTRNEKTGFKIREAQLQKIPYMIVVGDREEESGKVAVRQREEGDLGSMCVDDFVARVKTELTD